MAGVLVRERSGGHHWKEVWGGWTGDGNGEEREELVGGKRTK